MFCIHVSFWRKQLIIHGKQMFSHELNESLPTLTNYQLSIINYQLTNSTHQDFFIGIAQGAGGGFAEDGG